MSADLPGHAGVVVIGGGIVGCSTAYHLARDHKADVVLIDPVLTGYSRLMPGGRPEDFLGVTADARATAESIRQWLTRHGRWNSPKYVVGESYGTIRAIALTSALSGGMFPPNGSLGAITLNGIAILGPAFGVAGGRAEGNDRAAMTDLPTMAAKVKITTSSNRFRVSVSVFNDMADIDRVLAALGRG